MTASRFALVPLAALVIATPARAADSGNFVYRLGHDTTSVERYTRSGDEVVVDQVGRAPRVLTRHYVYRYAKGALTGMTLTVTPPGASAPTQTIEARVDGDSLRLAVHNATGNPQNSAIAFPAGTLVVAGTSPWAQYEPRIMSFVRGKADSLRTTMYFLGGGQTDWLTFYKLGRDSIAIRNGHLDDFHVQVDKSGHVLGVLPIEGTAKFAVQRVATLDLPAMTAAFAAREQAGGGLGALSPRDTLNVTAGGAALWIDYGRPAKRGRTVFGGVVPYGEVWRTGANAATQFRTDKPLELAGTTVPPGTYTLWTIPSANGWKLLVNSQTGQWGTEHHIEKDLFGIDMKLTTLPQVVERFTISVDPAPQGGTLNFDWDTTRASVPFTVKADQTSSTH